MNKPVKLAVVSLLVCMVAISVGSVAAMNGYQNGDLDRVQLREQLQDGSCCEAEAVAEQQQEMAQEQTQEQLQEQFREQFRDGSCGENEELEEPVQERSQLREQFRYGCTE